MLVDSISVKRKRILMNGRFSTTKKNCTVSKGHGKWIVTLVLYALEIEVKSWNRMTIVTVRKNKSDFTTETLTVLRHQT